MYPDNFNAKKALQSTRIIYFALTAGSLLFLIAVLNLSSGKLFFKSEFTDPLIISLPILLFLTIPMGYIISKKLFRNIDPNFTLKDKYPVYQSGLLIRLSTCNGVALLSVVCLLLTNNLMCLIFFLIVAIIFAAYYPTPDKIGIEINLTEAEIDLFNV
jgi:hypothetical protein